MWRRLFRLLVWREKPDPLRIAALEKELDFASDPLAALGCLTMHEGPKAIDTGAAVRQAERMAVHAGYARRHGLPIIQEWQGADGYTYAVVEGRFNTTH